nr:phospholipase A2 isoform X1 [Leptinotarsa decemlineata]
MNMKLVQLLTVWNFLLVYETAASTVFICNYGMSKMIELTTRPPYCVVQKDKGKIRDMLLNTDSTKMKQMSDNSIEELEEACKKSQIKSPFQGGFIYPGTKWCGPGNKAQNHTDLGFHVKEDKCCRDHDKCPRFLSTGECSQGICNNSPFTRSHCDCDAAFRKCLQNVNSETANTIGAIFFNIIQVICFKERTPCTPWQRWINIPEKYNDKCALNFKKSARNGYTKAEADALCAQIHFRPSEKYVPLMPLL